MLDRAGLPIKIAVVSIFALIVFSYAYYQTRNIARGPIIEVSSPRNGETFTAPLIEIAGVAKNAARITLNDRPIFIDENGNFREKLLLSGGYNIIDLKAGDKFGEKTEKTLEVILK